MNPSNRKEYSKGEKIGSCIFLSESHVKKWVRYCIFLCDCGKEFTTRLSSVSTNKTTSCGCVGIKNRNAKVIKHNMSRTPEYKTLYRCRSRCYNKKYPRYKDWGGRGIRVCQEWLDSFETFYKDMGPRPSEHHSLERIDNNKDYCKENCKWGTEEEQVDNKRNTIRIELNGITKTLSRWAKDLGVNKKSLDRKYKNGQWPENSINQ